MSINLNTTLDQMNQATADIEHFFDAEGCLSGTLVDCRDNPWADMGQGPAYWPEGYDLTSPDDDDYDTMEQEGETYGTSKWEAGGFTMYVVDCNGSRETWIFDNAKRVELTG